MKILHTIVVLFLISSTASAQQITEKDLLGKWQGRTLKLQGIIADYEKQEVIALPEVHGSMAPEEIDAIMEQLREEMKNGTLLLEFFPGGKMSGTNGLNFESHGYTIETDPEGKQILKVEGSDPVEISLIDGELRIRDSAEELFIAKFKRVE